MTAAVEAGGRGSAEGVAGSPEAVGDDGDGIEDAVATGPADPAPAVAVTLPLVAQAVTTMPTTRRSSSRLTTGGPNRRWSLTSGTFPSLGDTRMTSIP
jgi:hypothetical protein